MFDPDEQLAKKIETYQGLAKENPNVDVGMLMMNALQNQDKNMVSSKAKKWAYLISISIPLVGFLFAVYYYMGDQSDSKQVAWICVALTVLSGLLYIFTGKLLLSGSGASLQQIQQIKPSDIMQLTQ